MLAGRKADILDGINGWMVQLSPWEGCLIKRRKEKSDISAYLNVVFFFESDKLVPRGHLTKTCVEGRYLNVVDLVQDFVEISYLGRLGLDGRLLIAHGLFDRMHLNVVLVEDGLHSFLPLFHVLKVFFRNELFINNEKSPRLKLQHRSNSSGRLARSESRYHFTMLVDLGIERADVCLERLDGIGELLIVVV